MQLALRSSSNLFIGRSPYTLKGCHISFIPSRSDLGVTNDRSLKFRTDIRSRFTSVNAQISDQLMCILWREPDFLININLAHVRPLIEYVSQIWSMGYRGDLNYSRGSREDGQRLCVVCWKFHVGNGSDSLTYSSSRDVCFELVEFVLVEYLIINVLLNLMTSSSFLTLEKLGDTTTSCMFPQFLWT